MTAALPPLHTPGAGRHSCALCNSPAPIGDAVGVDVGSVSESTTRCTQLPWPHLLEIRGKKNAKNQFDRWIGQEADGEWFWGCGAGCVGRSAQLPEAR